MEDVEVGGRVLDFVQMICGQFREKEEPWMFVERFLFGVPIFRDHFSDDIQLITRRENEFSLWYFLNEGDDITAVLKNAHQTANKLEASTQKSLARVVTYQMNPSRIQVFPKATVEQIVFTRNRKGTPTQIPRENKGQRTTVIVLDLEGQFKPYVEALAVLSNKLHQEMGIETVSQTSVLSIPKNACLSFSQLAPDDLTYFTPDLTAKSQDSFTTAIAHAKERQPNGFAEMMRLIEEEVEHGVRNPQIKSALTRTTTSLRRVFEELFDKDFVKPLLAEDLLVPGKITIVDVSELSENHQRYVAIYLLTILHNKKMMENDDVRTVLVLDEAHKMFPRKFPTQYKDFYRRIFEFVNEIVHKGRKRHYGVVVATQQPKDVAEMILNLPDSKVIFEVDGERRWMSEMLDGKEPPSGIGNAFIVLRGPSIEPLLVKIPNVMGLLKDRSDEPSEQNETRGAYTEGQTVGYILQREKTPLSYKIGENQVYANIPQKYAPLVMPGLILVAKGQINGSEPSTTLFCELESLKAFETRQFVPSKTDDGLKDQFFQGFETTVILTVKREISSDGYDGSLRNQNYSNLKLFTPTEEEVRKCFNLPEVGFPLGEFTVSAVTQQKLTYFLPYGPDDFLPHNSDWQIDHSVLVVGSQGRGKTNFLVFLSALLVAAAPEELGQRIIRMAG